MALCPHCNNAVMSAVIQEIPMHSLNGSQWRGISYACGSCGRVLSVAIDPVSLKSDTVDEVRAALGRH